ncbi:MAG: hypothetical protein QM752_03015 [Gammaproteobacteria bacterium]
MLLQEIENLNDKIAQLLEAYKHLKQENQVLVLKLEQFKQEQDALADKNQLAVIKIQKVITQLKEEIHERDN